MELTFILQDGFAIIDGYIFRGKLSVAGEK
jgi:hypothetical protein